MQTPSLLPYLQGSDSNLYLDLRDSLVTGQFCPDYSSGLLADGFKIGMRTNAGSLIRKADLLIQPDIVPEARIIAGAWTNIDIETAWQKACRLHSQRDDDTSMLISGQVDEEGRFLPFSPLLFCTRRNIFFGPLCRQCLRPLQLCRDDALLQQRGLPLYSKSLARYLYCPSCSLQNDSPWYEKVRNAEVAAEVGDERQLLADMGAVSLAAETGTGFPCCDCPYQEQCFGERFGVEQAVAVFSFYPFYALFLDSTDCNGRDFLVRVSGATVDQAATLEREQTGTKATSAFSLLSTIPPEEGFLRPRESGAAFAEILYLKVLFLREVARLLFSGEEPLSLAGHSISPGDLRVKFDPISSFQKFWSFSVVFPGLCGPDMLNERPKTPDSGSFHMFGMLWFLVLGINSEQGESEIYRKLNLLLEQESGSSQNPDSLVEFLPPGQVLWEPSNYTFDSEFETKYREVLDLGWDILLSAYAGQQAGATPVCSRIEACLHSLRSLVFSSGGNVEKADFCAEDKVIGDVVERLKRKWQAEVEPVPGEQGDTSPGVEVSIHDDFSSETVVLTGEDGQTYDGGNIHHDETVIIQAGTPEQTRAAVEPSRIDKPSEMNEMEATVRLSPQPGVEQGHTAVGETGQPFLEETIVLNGEKTTVRGGSEAGPGEPISDKQPDVQQDDEDFMTETVVLKPRKEGG